MDNEILIVQERTVAEAWYSTVRKLYYTKKYEKYNDGLTGSYSSATTAVHIYKPNILNLHRASPVSIAELARYVCQFVYSKERSKSSYTYHSRMRADFGYDQIEEVISQLSRKPYSRSSQVVLWDAVHDLVEDGDPPCLNTLWYRIENCELHCCAVIRSNDLYQAGVYNWTAIAQLQNYIAEQLRLRSGMPCKIGTLTIFGFNTHLYYQYNDKIKLMLEKTNLLDMYPQDEFVEEFAEEFSECKKSLQS